MVFLIQLFFKNGNLMFLKCYFVFQKSDILWIILIFLAVVILKFFVVSLHFLNFFLKSGNLILVTKGCLGFNFKTNWFGNSFLDFFELSDLKVDFILSFNGFNFDGFKKVFDFNDKAIDLFLLFNFVLGHDFFKALINI